MHFLPDLPDSISQRYLLQKFLNDLNSLDTFQNHTLIHPSDPPIVKKKYKLAYYITIQEEAALDQLKLLLNVLDDGLAVILIYYDPYVPAIHSKIHEITSNRLTKFNPFPGNIFFSKIKYNTTFGHASNLYAQLNGYFELQDIAEWEYLINLSAFDWPLRKNPQLVNLLQKRDKYSWINYWLDSKWISENIFRPHVRDTSTHANTHYPEFGLRAWPFPNWRVFRQSPWMILTNEAIKFIRNDAKALNFLAFLEFANLPEEIFFATVLFNNPEFENKIYNEKRRYTRDIKAGGISWIGWQDRHIFPPGETEPRHLFLSPFNANGDMYGEDKFMRWIERNHLNIKKENECTVDQIGYRDECLLAFAEKIAKDDHLILIPVSKKYLSLAANLRCSLFQLGYTNIIHWALDSETNDELIEAKHFTIYNSDFSGSSHLEISASNDYINLMGSKPIVLKKLLNAGYHIWSLDADTVVLDSFSEIEKELTNEPFKADILISIDERNIVASKLNVGRTIPNLYSGIMYFRNTPGTIHFLDNLERKIVKNFPINNQDALQLVIKDESAVLFTGIGHPKDDSYPSHSTEGSLIKDNPKKHKISSLEALGGIFYLYKPHSLSDAVEASLEKRARIHILDQFQFVNGYVYFENSNLIPNGYRGFKMVNAKGQMNPESVYKSKGLWFINDKRQCTARKPERISEIL